MAARPAGIRRAGDPCRPGAGAIGTAGTRHGCHRLPSLLTGNLRVTAGRGGPGFQLTALFTSAAIFASSAAVSSFSAK